MKRVLLSAFLSAIIMMGVGSVFWMGFAGFGIIKPVPQEDAVLVSLKQQIPMEGVYVLPAPVKDQNDPAFQLKSKNGPLVQIFYHQGGEEYSMPVQMLFGFALYFVSALLLGALLLMARLPSYGNRFLFVLLAGIFATISVQLLNPVWWHHPWHYHLVTSLHQIVNWFLSGLLMAAVIRPQS